MKISTLCKALVLVALVIAVAVPVCAFSGSGAGTSASPYVITSYEQLNEMRNDPDACYKLNNNIVANDPAIFEYTDGVISGVKDASNLNVWVPFEFSGTFDGVRKYITGLYVPEDYANGGLFSVLTDATVKRAYFDFALIEADENAGIIAGKAEGTTVLDNCFVAGSVIGKTTKEMNNVGGMVGVLGKDARITGEGTTASQLANVSYADVTGATSYSANVGGFAGLNYGTVTKAVFAGNVYGTATYYDAAIGGIAGYNTGSVTYCRTEYGKVGGESTAKINDCYVGGVVGLNKGTVQYCENAVAVSNKNYSSGDSICAVGGVVGMNLDTDLYNNTNKGAVSGEYSYAGGIAGVAVSDTGSKYVSGNDNTGAVTAQYGVAGGIVGRAVAAGEGYISIKLFVEDCYNAGALSGNKTGEMAGETANVESASVTVGAEGSANNNATTTYYASVATAESVQYVKASSAITASVTNVPGASLTLNRTNITGTDRYIVRASATKASGTNYVLPFKPVMVTLVAVTDATKVEILSVDATGLALGGNTLSGNVIVKVYKPATFTGGTSVTGFSVGNKYAATNFATLKDVSEGRVEEVIVPVNATVDVTGTVTVNALVVDGQQSMNPLCENKEISK